jgi:hypothetical protein
VALAAQFGSHGSAAFTVHIGQHHMGLFVGKAAGAGFANAIGCPGHDDNTALQAK